MLGLEEEGFGGENGPESSWLPCLICKQDQTLTKDTRLLLGERASYLIEQVVQVVVDLFIVKAGVLILVHWFVFIVGIRLGCLNDRTVEIAPVDKKEQTILKVNVKSFKRDELLFAIIFRYSRRDV